MDKTVLEYLRSEVKSLKEYSDAHCLYRLDSKGNKIFEKDGSQLLARSLHELIEKSDFGKSYSNSEVVIAPAIVGHPEGMLVAVESYANKHLGDFGEVHLERTRFKNYLAFIPN